MTANNPKTGAFQAANRLSLKQLNYLVQLSDTLHFTRAAERCFVTQSTLSGGIQELESQLGVQLVERSNKHVMFTAIGADVASRAQAMLAMGADLIDAAKLSADPANASIRLGAIPTIAPFMLPALMRELRARREVSGAGGTPLPAPRVLLREDQTAVLLHAVETGALDAALIALPMDVGRLAVWPLLEEELWLIASTKEATTHTQAPTVRDLDMTRLMLLGDGHCLSEHTLRACSTAMRGKAMTPSDIEATSLTTLIQMVEAGLGVAMLPSMAVRAGLLNASEVIAKPFASPAPKRTIALVHRATQSPHHVLSQIRELAQAFGKPSTGGAKRSKQSALVPG